MFAALRRRVPRLGRFPRLCAIGICLLLAARSAATDAAARRPVRSTASVAVVVAARALPAGHLLAGRDVRVVRWPAGLPPGSARHEVATVVGHRLSGPLAAGEPITGTRLLGPDLATGLPAGEVAAAVPLADGHAVDLVRPGDRIDVLATPNLDSTSPPAGAGGVRTVAREARVLAVFAALGDGSGAELVVAVPRPVAVEISRASPAELFTAVLAPP